jgi:DNA-binding transcriptional regulator GbsR (MarR family)
MASPPSDPDIPADIPAGALVDQHLLEELPVFERFFKTFGFKRVHGRVWGLLVLSDQPLASKEISARLGISQAATSTSLTELAEWGAITSSFDSPRRCHLHTPVGNALSIVATVFKRRERIVFQQFRQMAQRSLDYITERHGERDPRVLTLRSIITTCDIGEAVMQLVFTAVQSAMSDSESLLSRALGAAFKVGVGVPARLIFGSEVQKGMSAAFAVAEGKADATADVTIGETVEEEPGTGIETGAPEDARREKSPRGKKPAHSRKSEKHVVTANAEGSDA